MKKTLLAFLFCSVTLSASSSFATQLPPSKCERQGYGPVIIWPKSYTPGLTDNYVSNEIIVKDLKISDVWPLLTKASQWPTYYQNASNITFHKQGETELKMGTRFKFTTFNFPVESEVTEFQPSVNGNPARIAWHGWVEGDAEHRLDVHHAWLLENMPGGRLRILTEESQTGKPAQQLHATLPNPMLNAHQLWLTGLVNAAQQAKN